MRKVIDASVLAVAVIALPALVSAATLLGVFDVISGLLNAMIGLFITLAIVIFFWGLIKYLMNAGEEKSEGLQIMFYGVLAIFVMVSLYGIIRLLHTTFKLEDNATINPPRVNRAN